MLRLLVIEDSEADFLLVQRSLRQHDVEAEFRRVDGYPGLAGALETGGWDAILSDYNVPGMDFRTTLGLIRNEAPDLPVILVSGSIGEEAAMDLLRRGLSDFVLKDRPTRLAGALRHALETAQVRRAQRAAEAALLESEARFSTIFKFSPLGIGLSRISDGVMVEANEALLELFSNTREELLGRTSLELGHWVQPKDRSRMMGILEREGRVHNFEFQSRTSDGRLHDLLMSGEKVQLGGEAFLLGMISDITPLKEAERALKASEAQYRRLFESMSDAFAHCRLVSGENDPPDWEYLAVNPAYERVLGLGDVTGRRLSETMPTLTAERAEWPGRLRAVALTGVPAKFENYLPAQGIWLAVSAYSPGPGEFVVLLDDITDRKRTEQALQASEARFQTIFKASPVCILLTRADDGAVLDANPAFLDLMELRAEEALGRTTLDLRIWASPDEREALRWQALEGGGVRGREVIIRTRTGKERIAAWSADPVDLGGECAILNLVEDLTERRKAEEERRLLEAEVAHAQKLDSLGALAGGVSHDMNNVLGAIMALGSLTLETHKDDPALARAMETLLHAAGRGRDLVKALTDFARKDIPEPRRLDLNEVVRKEAGLLHRTTLQKVSVELALQPELPPIQGDPSSISNALMNLCVNALDAMPAGGQLTLSTRIGSGGEVALSVRDTGQGMPPDVVERALEPFFTTKPAGKGTGLGLALVYGVMKAHGGRVDIQSRVGHGTEILLSFPPLEDRAEGARAAEAPAETPQVCALQVLLVDDDELIRLTIPPMLEALGHGVETVSGGLEALQRLESGARPDLVILDLSMPGLDGEETLERLRTLRADLPVLLATGFRDERHARILERFSGVEVIQKPFSLADLRGRLAWMR